MRPTFASAWAALVCSPLFAALLACADRQPPAVAVRPPPPPPVMGQPPAVTPGQPMAAPSTVVFPMIPQATCVLRGTGRLGTLSLSLHDQPLTDVDDEVQWAETHFTVGRTVGTVVGRTSTLDFAAELQIQNVMYTPTSRRLQDGWIIVEHARAREVTPTGEIVGAATLPRVVATGSSTVPTRHRCGEVALGWRPPSRTGNLHELRRGAKGTLRDAPNGRVLAQLAVPPMPGPGRPADHYAPFYARLLEQQGSMVKLSISDMDVTVEAWTEASVLVPKPPSSLSAQAEAMQLPMLAAVGVGPGGGGATCSRPVTVFVRDGDRPVPIAAFRPGAAIRRALDAGPQAPGEMPVFLWRGYSRSLVPFVLESDLATCNASQPDREVITAVPGRGLVLARADAPPPIPPIVLGPSPSPAPTPSPPSAPRRVEGPKAEVVIGALAATPPAPNRESVVRATRARIRQCYQRGLDTDPSMTGKLVVELRIDTSGQVLSSVVTSNAGLSQSVVSCAVNALRLATFPAGSPGSVSVPLTLVHQGR